MRTLLIALCASSCVACTGWIGDTGEKPAAVQTEACGGSPIRPLRRMTNLEYDNTVHDILGEDEHFASAFEGDERSGGFKANNLSPVTEIQIDKYLEAASALAERALARNQWFDCDPEVTACAQPVIASLGRKLYRRPLTAGELESYTMMYEAERNARNANDGVTLVLEAMLVSPSFLYLAESEVLTPFERATRLAYFLWSSPPDEELLAAAENGELETREQVASQVERMVQDDARIRRTIESFVTQWLEIDTIGESFKNPLKFPDWTPKLARALLQESKDFGVFAMADGERALATLLTAPMTIGGEDIAKFYGGTANPDGTVSLDPATRSGVLTQAAVLATHADAEEGSWVHRGLFVRQHLMCDVLAPPPINADVTGGNTTARLENPECQSCHRLIDHIGMGFDGYDATGAFVGGDVPTGTLYGLSGPDLGTFGSVVELGQKLADNPEVAACFAQQWTQFAKLDAFARTDQCAVDSARDAFVAGNQDVRSLLAALAMTAKVAGQL